MIETEIKKLTEALFTNNALVAENNTLLQAHIDLRKDNNSDGTAKCCKKEKPAKDEAPGEEEKDETQEIIDAANKREAKRRKDKAAKKAKREAEEKKAAAQEAADKKVLKDEDDEEEDIPEEPETEGEVTHEDVRKLILDTRKALKKSDGSKAVSQHRRDVKDLLEEGGYEAFSKVPADEIADFYEDVKALTE
jgi:hypothetical protein